jgi:hypothetical protein
VNAIIDRDDRPTRSRKGENIGLHDLRARLIGIVQLTLVAKREYPNDVEVRKEPVERDITGLTE